MKFGNLNFLEPSGALQDCNGTALPLPLLRYVVSMCTTNSRYMGMKFYDGELLFRSYRYIGIAHLFVCYKTVFRQEFLLPSSADSVNFLSCARSVH